MKTKKLYALIIALLIFSNIVFAKTITDMAGRVNEIPGTINKVMPYDSKISVLLFSCAKNLLFAKAIVPGKKSFKFISSEYKGIPEVDVKNIEEVISAAPDIIIAGGFIPQKNYNYFERLQKRTNIPVIVVDLSVNKLDETYKFLGNLFNKDTEYEKYSNFLLSIYKTVDSLQASNQIQNITAYYTIGTNGLMTDPSGSKHTEVLDYMKIPNTAKIDIPSSGHAKVNMEQVMIWNPDYIFASSYKGESNAYNTITKNRKWREISAVKNNNVYQIPSHPFGWLDHPPSVNRIPAVIWFCHIFYAQSEEKTRSKITEFYELFYKYKLTLEDYQSFGI